MVQLAPVLEVRVHGVVDAAPEHLLDHLRPQQVSGDELSGFYRRPDWDGLEAYSWSKLTVRSPPRTGWLAALPFALANVAGWLIPHEPTASPATVARLQKAVVRLVALSMTVLLALGVWLLAVDLIAYQCGGREACRSWLPGVEAVGTANPARRIVIGMVAPVAAIALVAYAGLRSRNRYEASFPWDQFDEREADPALVLGLRDEQFWHSTGFVHRLARLHVAAGLTSIALVTSLALWRLERAGPIERPWQHADLAVFVTAVVWLALIVVSVAYPSRATTGMVRSLQGGAAAMVVMLGIVGGFVRGPDVAVPGAVAVLFDEAHVTTLTGAFSLLLIALAVLAAFDRERRRPPVGDEEPGGFGAAGPLVTATLAAASMALVVAPAVVGVARWLDRGRAEEAPIAYSPAFDWLIVLTVAFGALLGMAWAMRMTLLAFGVRGWREGRWAALFDRMYEGHPGTLPAACLSPDAVPCHPTQRAAIVREVARMWRRRMAGSASHLVSRVVLVAVFAIAVLVAATARDGLPPLPNELSFVVGGIFAAATLYAIVRRLRGRQPNAELTGRLAEVATWWDVVTFWPRWYHPLAPPAPGTRAVPELSTRLGVLTESRHSTRTPVVLAGHGTGSVLATASVMRLSTTSLPKVALVTLGSPLRRVYGRYFRAHLGSKQLRAVEASLRSGGEPRWKNLYRLTDQLGGAVFGEHLAFRTPHGEPLDPNVDILVADPITDHHELGNPCPHPMGQRGYFSGPPPCSCPPYDEVLAAMRKGLHAPAPNAPPSPTSGSPPPPPAAPPAAGPGTAGT